MGVGWVRGARSEVRTERVPSECALIAHASTALAASTSIETRDVAVRRLIEGGRALSRSEDVADQQREDIEWFLPLGEELARRSERRARIDVRELTGPEQRMLVRMQKVFDAICG